MVMLGGSESVSREDEMRSGNAPTKRMWGTARAVVITSKVSSDFQFHLCCRYCHCFTCPAALLLVRLSLVKMLGIQAKKCQHKNCNVLHKGTQFCHLQEVQCLRTAFFLRWHSELEHWRNRWFLQPDLCLCIHWVTAECWFRHGY